jgi:hypothetical protein
MIASVNKAIFNSRPGVSTGSILTQNGAHRPVNRSLAIAPADELRSLRAFTKHPFAYPGRALRECNAPVFATDEESNHTQVHKGDFAQIEYLASASVIHCLSNARDAIRLNVADQPEIRAAATGVSFNPEHFGLKLRREPLNTWPLVSRETNSDSWPGARPHKPAIAPHLQARGL